MPPPQHKELGNRSSCPLFRDCVFASSVLSAGPVGSVEVAGCLPVRHHQEETRRGWLSSGGRRGWEQAGFRRGVTTECIRSGRVRRLPCSFILVSFVFVCCVVPLSTPSSTHDTVSTSTTTPTTNLSNNTSSLQFCPKAQEWIHNSGSFCFTLRKSSFLRNASELAIREMRAIHMFCDLERILDRVDCGQPYSVNKQQCSLCLEAYRDWACAMMTDTLEDGRMDCDGGVMPCPSCASICHQVMRLCPYLTPDRVQFDEYGDPTPHVSQYGGHPAFYCPLENIHASDPAYTSECSSSKRMYEDPRVHDNLHNSCAENAKYMRRSSRDLSSDSWNRPLTQISSCCWTYASSLVQYSGLFAESMREHNRSVAQNRVILNCCDHAGNCISSDPEGVLNSTSRDPESSTNNYSTSSYSPGSFGVGSTPSSTLLDGSNKLVGSTLRTANNQVRGEDGTFRELSNAYLHDEGEDEEEDDEEYYDDSSSSAVGDSYSSGASSSNELIGHAFRASRNEQPSHVISIHRDNKIYSTRESRSVHDTLFYISDERASAASSGAATVGAGVLFLAVGNLVALVLCASGPPVLAVVVQRLWRVCYWNWCALLFCSDCAPGLDRSSGIRRGGSSSSSEYNNPGNECLKDHVLWSPITTTNNVNVFGQCRVVAGGLVVSKLIVTRCSCCELLLLVRIVSNYSDLLINLPINTKINLATLLRLSHRKLVVNHVISRRYYILLCVSRNPVVMDNPTPPFLYHPHT